MQNGPRRALAFIIHARYFRHILSIILSAARLFLPPWYILRDPRDVFMQSWSPRIRRAYFKAASCYCYVCCLPRALSFLFIYVFACSLSLSLCVLWLSGKKGYLTLPLGTIIAWEFVRRRQAARVLSCTRLWDGNSSAPVGLDNEIMSFSESLSSHSACFISARAPREVQTRWRSYWCCDGMRQEHRSSNLESCWLIQMLHCDLQLFYVVIL